MEAVLLLAAAAAAAMMVHGLNRDWLVDSLAAAHSADAVQSHKDVATRCTQDTATSSVDTCSDAHSYEASLTAFSTCTTWLLDALRIKVILQQICRELHSLKQHSPAVV